MKYLMNRCSLEMISKEDTMAHVINGDCISCGSCEGECPTSAISQGDSQYVINAEACIDCGACASVCPVDAISAE